MKKAVSPLMATVLLLAITLAVGGILGSWFVSLSKTETAAIEKKALLQINCTGALDIVKVTCDAAADKLEITVHNLATGLSLYDFSTFALINNTAYTNNTGGPNSTSQLDPGQQTILLYYCSDAVCPINATVSKIRVSPGNCPVGWVETSPNELC